MKRSLLFTFLTLFILSSCSDESSITPAGKINSNTDQVELAKQELLTLIEQNKIQLPKALLAETSSSISARISEDSEFDRTKLKDYDFNRSIVERAISGSDYDCGPTLINSYVSSIIQDWDNNDISLYNYAGGSIVFDAVYLFDNVDGGQYYGPDGQFTNQINRTFKDLLRFWNIPTDILIRDAHGNVFDDVAKVTSILMLYGNSPGNSQYIAELFRTLYGSDKYYNFNHPLLTFNAFAARADPYWETPKKIVMGDGFLKAFEELGFGDVAPQAILAHEYGHHVQFAKNVTFVNSPEGTRKTELMADALAAYYLTSKRGATMNWKRVQQFLEVFFHIGDCQFTSSNHHGTPNQRMKAASFGYDVANSTMQNGKILTAEEFIVLFEAKLPTLIAPDNF